MELQASVITGFESIAAEEVREVFGKDVAVSRTRGSVRWKISDADSIQEALHLRSIDNLFAVVYEDTVENFGKIQREEALKKCFEKYCIATGEANILDETQTPTFRVTCNRAGEKTVHQFSSMDAARSLGAAINNCFSWRPKMKGYDVEIVINIRWDKIICLLSLNTRSLFERNIVAYGPTTMRSTMCHCMMRLAAVKPGWIVVDPMCGGGSLPIEGALSFSKTIFLAGDNFDAALERCNENLMNNYGSIRAPVAFMQWDAKQLPLRDNSVDAIVTDLPFGKRLGSVSDNRILYPALLHEWMRVVRSGGILVVMTHDKRSFEKALMLNGGSWRTVSTHMINQGGLTTLCAKLVNAKKA